MSRRAAAVAVAGFTNFLNLYTPQAILPLIAADFAVDGTATGQTITAALLAVALVAPFAGAISDRFGRKRLIVAAGLLLSIPTLLIAGATSLEAMLVWRFLQGLALPFIFAVVVAYIGEEADGAEGVRLAGIYGIGTILGGFGGRFVAGIAADLAGWRAGFLVIGLFTLAAALFIAWMLPAERRFQAQRGGFRDMLVVWRSLARNTTLLATCMIGFGMLFTNVATYTFVNLHLAAPPYGLTPAQLGGVFAVYLLGVVTTAIATRLVLRIGRRPTLILAVGLAAIGLLLSLLPSLVAAIAGLALLSGGMFVVQTLSLGFIAATITQAKSSAVGMYVTAYYIGGALGGVVPAPAWGLAGWPGVVGLNLLVLVAIATLAQVFWRSATPR